MEIDQLGQLRSRFPVGSRVRCCPRKSEYSEHSPAIPGDGIVIGHYIGQSSEGPIVMTVVHIDGITYPGPDSYYEDEVTLL